MEDLPCTQERSNDSNNSRNSKQIRKKTQIIQMEIDAISKLNGKTRKMLDVFS